MAAITLPVYPGVALRNGAFGVDVALIQTELTAFGFTATVDGIYGSGTSKAVVAYQATRGLSADGVVGKGTWDRLINEYAQKFTTTPVPYPGIVMRTGALGSCVKWFQTSQNGLRKPYTAQPQLAGDGVHGSGSTRAARLFQRQFGLSIDGQIGRNTWQMFSQVLMCAANGVYTKVMPAYPGTALKLGSSGDAVRCVQSYLGAVKVARGLNYPTPVIDGRFGSVTRSAVIGFQAAFGLTTDGIVGPTTWQRLVSEFNLTL